MGNQYVIVVRTDDFEVYHEVVTELRDRGATFTTVGVDEPIADETSIIITDPATANDDARSEPNHKNQSSEGVRENEHRERVHGRPERDQVQQNNERDDTDSPAIPTDGARETESHDADDSIRSNNSSANRSDTEEPTVQTIIADPSAPRDAVDRAFECTRGGDGRTIVGVDPGRKPGIAVLKDDTVVAAFQVPLADAVDVIREETATATDPLVRIGDGSRLDGATIVNELEEVRVEIVDETATTPYLGTGARGMGDVIAAINIARRSGSDIETRTIEPTAGELQVIKDRSREQSETNRTIDDGLAKRVAAGELTIDEALSEHRSDADRSDSTRSEESEEM